MAQFPLGMGLDTHTKNNKTLALQYDGEGKLRHDAVARIGHSSDKVFHKSIAFLLFHYKSEFPHFEFWFKKSAMTR